MVDGQREKSIVGGRSVVDLARRVYQCLARSSGGGMGVFKVFGVVDVQADWLDWWE